MANHVSSQKDILQRTQKHVRIKKAKAKRGINESALRFNSSAKVCE